MALVFDVETDGFLDVMTVIHCLHIKDRRTGRRMRFSSGRYADGTPARRDGTVEEGVRMLMEADCIVGHNIIGFDLLAIRKLFPWFAPKGRIIDTLVWARLIWTNLKEIDSDAIKRRKRPAEFTGKMVGAHTLEAWGFRLGVFKGDYSKMKADEAKALGLETDEEIGRYTWGTFNREMDDYCEQDNEGTEALLSRIEQKEYSAEALELETQVAIIIQMQEAHGFLFDQEKALKLTAELTGRRAELEDQLRETFKPWFQPERKHGMPVVLTPKTNHGPLGRTKGCPLTKVELVIFNPGSRHHIANRMKTLFGWIPTEFTPSGEPKVDETTLGGLNYPEAKLLVEYLTVQKRLGQIAEGEQAWLKVVKPDGRIHGRVNPNGARTGRMTHFTPNMAQVPATHALYGTTCRECFMVPMGYRLVGCDAEGLELRMLGHYMARFDGGAYADTVVNGKKEDGTDVHTVNQKVIRLRSRDSAKTFIYAYLYGAGNPKLGSIIYDDMTPEQQAAFNVRVHAGEEKARAAGKDPADVKLRLLGDLGIKARKRIEEGLPALGKLQELVKAKSRRGFLKGLDGRILHNKSAHAALNTLLQGGGAIVMKKALVICFEKLTELGLVHGKDYAFVANVHDEFQIEVLLKHVELVKEVARESIRLAGEYYKLLCPLAGAADDGANWAETH